MFPRSDPEPALDRWEEDPQAELEAVRQRDWEEFVALLLEQMHELGSAAKVASRVSAALRDTEHGEDCCAGCFWQQARDFAASYSWPSVFRALAQAIEAADTLKREAERRR